MNIFDNITSGVERIVGRIGNISDGALSIYDDWADKSKLDDGVRDQAAGLRDFFTSQINGFRDTFQKDTQQVQPVTGLNTRTMLIFAGVAAMGLAAISVVRK